MSAVETAARIATVVIKLLEAVLPFLPANHQVKVIDSVQEWLERRRKTINRHQSRNDALRAGR